MDSRSEQEIGNARVKGRNGLSDFVHKYFEGMSKQLIAIIVSGVQAHFQIVEEETVRCNLKVQVNTALSAG